MKEVDEALRLAKKAKRDANWGIAIAGAGVLCSVGALLRRLF